MQLRHVIPLVQQIPDTWAIFRRQWQSPEAIRAWQTRRLRTIVSHAYENVPFHRQRMQAAGVTPADIRSLADLGKLPLSTKAEIREAGPATIARSYGPHNSIHERTSGSSGAMLDILHDQRAFNFSMALLYRQYHAIGYRLWHRRAYIRFQPFSHPLAIEQLGLGRREFVPFQAEPAEQLARLREIQPDFITSYPSSLLLLINSVPREELAAVRPRAILTNSEHYSPEEGQLMREAFQCEVYDEYSSFELYQMAFQCSERRYHIISDNLVMEFLDEQGRPVAPGQEGEIVVTGLINRAMPFIRYRTSDIAVPSAERCPCGRGLPVIERINGRRDDLLHTPSGRRVNPIKPTAGLLRISGLIECQLVQERIDHLTAVSVVANNADREAVAAQIRDTISRPFAGEPMTFEVKFVDRIERGATGKRKSVVVSPAVSQRTGSSS
jgi:phenylacetate-CoA ligase